MSKIARYRCTVQCDWRLTPESSPPEEHVLIGLLQAIAETGALGEAARRSGVSYRNAWGMLRRWEDRLGQALVRMEQGKGSALTRLAEEMLALDRDTRQRVAPILDEAAQRMSRLIDRPPSRRGRRVQASHDLALEILAGQVRATGHGVELEFRGSLEALAAFSSGQCDMAGFHCAIGEAALLMWGRYRPLLKERFHALVSLCEREQGIMVAAGNPKRIRGLEDLSRKGMRFVNRQTGAGTRMLLDALLGARGISGDSISGYGSVEFTHGAIAAMIASGQADAGLGIAAAARRFGLEFLPLAREHYLLAVRRSSLSGASVAALLAAVRSEEFERAVAKLPGYDLRHAGRTMSPEEFRAMLGGAGA